MSINIIDETTEITFNFSDYDMVANIKYSYSYVPANLDGLWENCQPVEEEFEYELIDMDFDGAEQVKQLSNKDGNEIITNASDFIEREQDSRDFVKELALDAYYTGMDYG